MLGAWRSRTLRILGVGALAVGAGLVVVSPANAAPVTDVAALRAAVDNLNGTGPAAEIELVPGTTYSLPGDVGCGAEDEDDNKSGDLDVLRSEQLTIFTPAGQSPAVLEVNCPADSPQRAIQVLRTREAREVGKLILNNVVIRNGHAPSDTVGLNLGGGVLSVGDVELKNVRIENNTAGDGAPGDVDSGGTGRPGGSGGGVAAAGLLTIDGSTFTGNRAGAGGAGLGFGDAACNGDRGGHGGLGGQGGAAFALGGLTITNSTFSGNTSGAGGNGGAGGCGATPAGAAAQPGGAGGDGGPSGPGGAVVCGGLRAGANDIDPVGCAGPMIVRGSTFDGNATGNGGNGANGGKGGTGAAGGDGGDGGSSELNGLGGAMLFVGRNTDAGPSTLLVENSTIDGNSTGNGGTGGNGGAGGDQPATGAPAGNGGDAGDGGNGGRAGAIVAGFADEQIKAEVATLVHATITENGGGGNGGQPGQPGASGGGGGGDTVVAAAAPGQPGDAGEAGGGSLAIFDEWASVSTVVGTTDASADGPDCWESSTNATLSLSTDADGSCFGPGSVQAFDTFGLGALADNGGPTKTRLPAATSSLVDKVTGVDGQLTVDQRGVGRPQATGADIGAVELQLIDMVVTKTASATSVPAGTAVTFTITAKNVGTSSPQPGVTIDDPNCSDVSAASGDANTNDTLDPGETFSYTCTATLTEVGTFTNTATAKITDGAGVEISRTASVDVEVTAAASTPPLAKTGANNPAPELLTGAGLLVGGVVLVLLGRPRRIKTRASQR